MSLITNQTIPVNPEELLKKYVNNPIQFISSSPAPVYDPQYGHNIPFFNPNVIPTMLRCGRIRMGLQMLKGPIRANTVFITEEQAENPTLIEQLKANNVLFMYKVKSKSEEEVEFIKSTCKQFWKRGLGEALRCIEWGFSCNQVIYKVDNSTSDGTTKAKMKYDYLKWYRPEAVRPLFFNQMLVGTRVRGVLNAEHGVDMFFPKVLWHVHNHSENPVFGESRLQWCSIPWHELYVCYGARDIRRMWFVKNAFDGGEMRYPIGKTNVGNAEVDNLSLATQMMANSRTGGFRIFPDDVNPTSGEQRWQYTPPSANVTPQGLMEYPQQLRYEVLEALGIPPEVIEAEEQGGMGSATGRKIPMLLYYSTLVELIDDVLNTLQCQVLDYLMFINYKHKDYSIERVQLEDINTDVLMNSAISSSSPPEGEDVATSTEEDTGLSV